MAGTVVHLGRRRTSPDQDFAEIASGQQLAFVADSTTQTIIVYELGMWAGRNGGSPSTRIGLGYVAGGGAVSSRWPGSLIRTTGPLTPSTTMGDQTGGSEIKASIDPVALSPANYALVATSHGGDLGIGMRQAATLDTPGQNRNFYRKSGLGSSMPIDPIEGAASYNGHLVIWGTGEVNVAPNVPTGLTPSGATPGTTLTPILTATFSDANEILNNGVEWDYVAATHVQVIRVADGAMMWDHQQAATSLERQIAASAVGYAGSALAYDTAYRYRVRHQDRSGAWSGWAETTFTLAGLGSLETPTNPNGFETSTQPGPITAVYRHQQGLGANAIQARLLSGNDAVLKTSPIVSVSVAATATASMSWAASTFGTLANGTPYGVQMRVRDTNGVWSTSWSPIARFRTNAAPNIPTNLSPSGGVARSSRPLLTCVASDPDGTQPTVAARIKNNSGTVLQTRAMTWNASTGRYEYQTTSTDLAAYGTFRWDARSSDGFLTSAYSAEATFAYAQGPTVTVTGPAPTIQTTTPVVTWDVSFTGGATQRAYTVQMYRAGDRTEAGQVYSSTYTTNTAARSHQIGSGAGTWLQGERWNNGEAFDIVVVIEDSNGLTSTSTYRTVTLSYTPPPSLALDGNPIALSGTHGTNAVVLSWELSDEPGATYEIYREELSGSSAVAGTRILLAAIDNPAETVLLDAEVTSGTLYRWELVQVVQIGEDRIRSVPTFWTGSVSFDGVILHAPYDPQGAHVALRYSGPGGEYAPEVALAQASSFATPFGSGGGRIVFFAPGNTADPSGEFGLITDEFSTANEKRDALMRLFHLQNGDIDGRPHVLCWREGRGGPHGRIYGVMDPIAPRIASRGGYVVTVSVREIGFALGEATS